MSREGEFVQIEDMQRSGRLLLDHVTSRFDKTLAGGVFPELAVGDIALLTTAANAIAADPNLFAKLARCIDDLGRRAAPANVDTIRLTRAYLKPGCSDDVGAEAKRRAGWIKVIFTVIFGFAALVTVLAVLVLAHVDSGRRSAQLLQVANKELDDIFEQITKVNTGAWYRENYKPPVEGGAEHSPKDVATEPFIGFCKGDESPYKMPNAATIGLEAQRVCSKWNQASLRQDLVYRRIRDWNCVSDRVRSLLMWRCPDDLISDNNNIKLTSEQKAKNRVDEQDKHWRRTELRTTAVILSLTGFVLPLLLGCIGGCAYVLRRLDRKLASFTLDYNDGTHAILRVLLATMLGGLLGVVWTADQDVKFGDFALSIAAAAFFVGFALEVVFSTIEAMVEGVANKVKGA